MNRTYGKCKTFDKAFKRFELTFCTLSILFVTSLVTLEIVLKNFSGFSFPWTEELYQYIVVWMVYIDGVINVGRHEHISVDIIYNMLPQKLYSCYRIILAVIAMVFLAAFAYFSYLEVAPIKATACASVTTPWFQMWQMYLRTMMSCGLMALEYFKTVLVLSKGGKVKARVGTKDRGLSKLKTM